VDPKIPKTYGEAIEGPDSTKWINAMQEEFDSLVINDTWRELNPPKNARIIRGKWVYALKRDEKGAITRFKARWVAKGFEQQYGINYDQTSAHHDYEIDQMDAVTAFLQSHMEDEAIVWVEMPTGFKKGSHACLLRKGMYGLKQSARL